MRHPTPGASDHGLVEPLDRDLERRLRRAVLTHAAAERRRHHHPILHVGEPGGRELVFAVLPDESHDDALASDIIAAMRSRTGLARPLVWLTRPGDLVLQDVDARWLRAALRAYAEASVPLVYVVANRHGWFDPRSGVRRVWKRLRDRRG